MENYKHMEIRHNLEENEVFSARIKHIRTNMFNMSQKEFAALINEECKKYGFTMTAASISSYENGKLEKS